MLRKYLIPVLLVVQVVVFLLLASVFVRQPAASAANDAAPQDAPQAQIAAAGQYAWSYAAKFVCGWQQPTPAGVNPQGEFIVKPGNYATDINIHNPVYKQTPLRKKFIVTVEAGQPVANEPAQVEPRFIMPMTLNADMVTMDDCNNLYKFTHPVAPAGPMPLTIGYLVILSPVELDVDVVYTAGAPGAFNVAPTSTSIDVERVTGKRVFIPTGALP